jgi:hypothetical protein
MPDPSLNDIPGIIMNPGMHWIPENGSSPEAAARNMDIFAADLIKAGCPVGNIAPLIEPSPEQELLLMGGTHYQAIHDGRYPFTIEVRGHTKIVEMPGLPIEEVRWMDEPDQDIFDFPRLFIDGSSWIWLCAVSVVANPECDDE